jgi:O-acetyl-ADP-ribose deacetylase (regulator of RNase III)
MGDIAYEHQFPGGRVLALVQGDLTRAPVEAIVNAANARLQHGGGLAGVIARRGGARIQDESDRWVRENGPASCERPAVTGAGDLPFRYVIHAVGPVWGEGDEDRKLASAVRTSLDTADSLGLASVGIPAISTGIFGFPKTRAAPIILSTAAAHLTDHPDANLRRIEVTLLDEPTFDVFRDAFTQLFPPSPSDSGPRR